MVALLLASANVTAQLSADENAAKSETSAPVASVAPASTTQQQQQIAKQKLDQVRAEIKSVVEQQRQTRGERDDTTRALREKEQAIAAIAKEVDAIDARLAAQQSRLGELESQRDALSAKLATQRAALGALLRSAYALGRNEQLRLLLQQDDVARIARVLAYHQYFQRAQVARIDSLLADLKQLADVRSKIESTIAELSTTRTARADEDRKLGNERSERVALLTQIDARLHDQGDRLAVLGKDEKAMLELLERLRDVFADIPKQPKGSESFESLRGKLVWPVKGRVLSTFASNDDSGRKTTGIRIAADTGTPVRAIAHGRVVFADWFKGYGLLLIVDHGDGYLSLYGYNETLRKEVGDWVTPGEVIASSGASGGQKSPSVYFELRRKSDPLDPRGWLGKSR